MIVVPEKKQGKGARHCCDRGPTILQIYLCKITQNDPCLFLKQAICPPCSTLCHRYKARIEVRIGGNAASVGSMGIDLKQWYHGSMMQQAASVKDGDTDKQ